MTVFASIRVCRGGFQTRPYHVVMSGGTAPTRITWAHGRAPLQHLAPIGEGRAGARDCRGVTASGERLRTRRRPSGDATSGLPNDPAGRHALVMHQGPDDGIRVDQGL